MRRYVNSKKIFSSLVAIAEYNNFLSLTNKEIPKINIRHSHIFAQNSV
jgi:hypothetical protein